jgi:hypothetical protein
VVVEHGRSQWQNLQEARAVLAERLRRWRVRRTRRRSSPTAIARSPPVKDR